MQIQYLAEADQERLFGQMQAMRVNPLGIHYMLPKSQILAFKVSGLKSKAALTIKQDLLAKGGEVVLPHQVLNGGQELQTVILLATEAQYIRLINGLKRQYFGLPELALQLEQALADLAALPNRIPWQNAWHSGVLSFERPLIMGILNITPDSFFDGGQYFSPEQALKQAEQLIAAGADILDIGGASSRPGHSKVAADEELRRIMPIIEKLAPQIKVPISVDSDQPAVVAKALQAGAAIINDIGGLQAEMAMLAAKTKAPLIIMHQGQADDIVGAINNFFAERLQFAVQAGIKQNNIILDPGFGFGKDAEHNLQLLNNLGDFNRFGRPLLIGLSNKRFIGAVVDKNSPSRENGNIAASTIAMLKCRESIIRCHQPQTILDAALMVKAMQEGVIDG